MNGNPPTWALTPGGKSTFTDVTDLVTSPVVDFRAEDLQEATCIRRTYNGEEHVVYVVPANSAWKKRASSRRIARRRRFGRYLYGGRRFRSLSAVARHITGDPTLSGNRFFKLRRRRRGKK